MKVVILKGSPCYAGVFSPSIRLFNCSGLEEVNDVVAGGDSGDGRGCSVGACCGVGGGCGCLLFGGLFLFFLFPFELVAFRYVMPPVAAVCAFLVRVPAVIVVAVTISVSILVSIP